MSNYDKLKTSLIKKYIKENKPNYYVILDDDQKVFSKDLNFIKIGTNGIDDEIIDLIRSQISLKENYETKNDK